MSRLPLDARRQQLLELGLALFSTRPFEEVSIDVIAQEAGISRGLLYHYFGNKRAFYVAVVEHAAELLLEALTFTPGAPPLELLRRGLEAYLTFVEERAEAYTAIFQGGSGADAEVLAVAQRTRETLIERIRRQLGLTDGQRSPLLELALRGWIGSVEATCMAWVRRREVARPVLLVLLTQTLLRHVEAAMALELDEAALTPATATPAPQDPDPPEG